jgi:hypothetical protein
MTKVTRVAMIAAICGTTPAIAQRSGPDSPTITHENPSSCLGAERAGRNSKGGDRAQGAFGQAQSDYVQYLKDGGEMSYGEFLQQWKAACADALSGNHGIDT